MSSPGAGGASERPAASVVILSVGGSRALLECLEALCPRGRPGVEVVVVSRGPLPDDLESRFPGVRALGLPATTSLPVLRSRGFLEARGSRVAFLGEHLRPGPAWLAAIERLDDESATSGPVEAGRLSRSVEWAFYLMEYAPFAPPLPETEVAAGSNCAYGRRALDRLDPLPEETFDRELHQRLHAAGVPFVSEPDLLARCEKRLSVAHLFAQRYHCARVSAAHRAHHWSGWRRVAFAAFTPLLPLVLLDRLLFTLVLKRRYGHALVRALPLILVAFACGAWGEAIGSLAGPGRSGERAE